MKISATCAGGFSGQPEHFELDTTRLANGPCIEAMLRNLEFLPTPPQPVGADIPRWRIEVLKDGQQCTIEFADDGSAASAPYASLIAELRANG